MTSHTLRPATEADSATLLRWRNDPETRSWARTSHEISATEHQSWLAGVLTDPARLLFVLEREGLDVATVRLDISDESEAEAEAEVSITVAPEARGQHVGSQALAATAAYAIETLPHVRRILAVVSRGNAASVRMFTKAGYQPRTPADPDWLELVLPL